MYKLYKGADCIVDYEAQNNQDITDYFKEYSNLEGLATLHSIDIEGGLFTIEEFPLDPISLEYLILMNYETNEYENVKL